MSSSPQRVSDTEGSEKPVREKLRIASIASIAHSNKAVVDDVAQPISDVTAVESNGIAPAQDDSARGRPSRKRSHEVITDATQDEPALKSRHGRKRSRETVDEGKDETSTKRKSSEEYEVDTANTITNGTIKNTATQRQLSSNHKRPASPAAEEDRTTAAADSTSPKTKKSKPDEKVDTSAEGKETEQATEDKKIGEPSEDKAKPTEIPSTSGFANSSAASSFSALAGNKSPTEEPASASAFKASGFGSLTASSTSGFASLAGPGAKLSSFASTTLSPPPAATDAEKSENDKPAATKTFGGALGSASPFATAGFGSASPFGAGSNSGFGSAGKGFGSGSGLGAGFGSIGGSKLGSFASTGTPGVIGGVTPKPFGASADDDEADEGSGGEEEDGAEAVKADDDDEKDERFFERDSMSFAPSSTRWMDTSDANIA